MELHYLYLDQQMQQECLLISKLNLILNLILIVIYYIYYLFRNQQTETSQELFFNVLEQEMRKIEQFTKKQVREIR